LDQLDILTVYYCIKYRSDFSEHFVRCAIEIAFPSVCLSVCLACTLSNQEIFRSLFTPRDSPGIWLSCEKNRAKIFAAFSPRGYIEWGVKNRDF